MEIYCLKERVFDDIRKTQRYGCTMTVSKKPENFSKISYGYIDYYTYFYTIEQAKNYIREPITA